MLAELFINALSVSERCLAIDRAIHRGKIKPEFDEDSLQAWRGRKTSLTSAQMDTVMFLRNYPSEVLSLALKTDITPEIKQTLIKATQESKWFQDICNVLQNHDFNGQYESNYALLFAPFLTSYFREVAAKIENNSYFNNEVIISLMNGVSLTLQNLCIRCIILELQEYTAINATNNSNGSLLEFLNSYRTKENLCNFYSKFPNLARRLSEAKERQIAFTLEIINNLEKAANYILDIEGEEITKLEFGAGDTHHSGRTVVKVTTNRERTFYYKPHALKVETAFYEIVQQLNLADDMLPLMLPEVITFDDFSIAKSIDYASCHSKDEVKNAYLRYGELLAISYVFGITDLHMENLVMAGENPVIVDGETFLANRLSFSLDSGGSASVALMDDIASFVTSSILLPSKLYLDSSMKSVDLGALSGGEQTIENILLLKDSDNINVRFERGTAVMPEASNLVRLDGSPVDYRQYSDDIIQGFDSTIKSIRAAKNSIVEILSNHLDARSRVLIRATNSYSRLLEFTLHPSCMQDRRETDKILENLFAMPGISERVYLAEYRDMEQMDVPYFTSSVGCVDLFDSEDNLIDSPFTHSAFQHTLNRLKDAEQTQANTQRTLIQAKTSMQFIQTHAPMGGERNCISYSQEKDVSRIYDLVDSIADKIISSAKIGESDETIAWLSLDEDHDYNPVPLQGDVYSGMSGVGLFLMQLGKELNNSSYLKFADKIAETLRKPPLSISAGLSAFVGPCSQALFALQYSKNNPSLDNRAFARENMLSVQRVIDTGKWEDSSWLTGVSSFLPLIGDYFNQTQDDRWLVSASTLAAALEGQLRLQQFKESGVAHGKLGVALSLAQYGISVNDSKYTELATKAIKEVIDKPSDEIKKARSFCRGSSGLISVASVAVDSGLLSSSDLDYCCDSFNFFQDILMPNDCLCHGNSSIIDAAVSAYCASGQNQYINYAWDIANSMIDRALSSDGFSINSFSGFPDVGLFKSLSGIAYSLLRLVDNKLLSLTVLNAFGGRK